MEREPGPGGPIDTARTGAPTLPSLPSVRTLHPQPGPADPVPTDAGTPFAPPTGDASPAPVSFAIPPLSPEATSGTAAPARKKRRRRRWIPIVVLLAVVGAILGVVLLLTSGGSEPAEPSDVVPVEPEPVDDRSDSPLVAPIHDAEDVMEIVNDNGAEEELLGQLGLDAEGNPLPVED